jgi:hypothetical protein
MALSLYVLKRVQKAHLDRLYEDHEKHWDEVSMRSHFFAEVSFHPDNEGYIIHLEDVAKFLMPNLEVDQKLDKHLGINKLHEKYWRKYFCDYVLDRYWYKFRNGKLPHMPPMIFEPAQLELEIETK